VGIRLWIIRTVPKCDFLHTPVRIGLRVLVQFFICCLTPMEWVGVCLSIYMNSKFQNFDFSFFSFFLGLVTD
jgi:hypothetical protein